MTLFARKVYFKFEKGDRVIHTSLTHGDLVDGTVPNKVDTDALGFV